MGAAHSPIDRPSNPTNNTIRPAKEASQGAFGAILAAPIPTADALRAALLEQPLVGFGQISCDARIVWANARFADLAGLAPHALVGRNILDLIQVSQRARATAEFSRLIVAGHAFELEAKMGTNDSKGRWVQCHFRAISFPSESVSLLVTLVDIQTRKCAEDTQWRAEQRLLDVVTHCNAPMMLFDERERILAMSMGWSKIFKIDADAFPYVGDWIACGYVSGGLETLQQLRDAMAGQRSDTSHEACYLSASGCIHRWRLHLRPLGPDDSGRRLFGWLAEEDTDRRETPPRPASAEHAVVAQPREDKSWME